MTLSRCSQCGVGWKISFFYGFFIYNHYTILVALTVFLSGFSSTMGAPAPSIENEQWWTHPCTGVPQIRHARSGRSPVDTQYGILSNRMQNSVLKELEALYERKPQSRMGNNCPKINAVLALMKKRKNVRPVNHIFYESIVELAKFINTLKNIPVKTRGKFNNNKRIDIYDEIELNLRGYLCEFNDTLDKNTTFDIHRIPIGNIRKYLSSKCLPKSMDLSLAQIIDYDVIRKLKKFLNQGRRILRQKKLERKKNKKVNKGTDNHIIRKSDKKVKPRSRHNKRTKKENN